MPPERGLSAAIDLTVRDADTAAELGSGDVPALATPRVVLLCEQATVAALAGSTDDDTTTVGQRIQLDHLAPVPVGDTVRAEATLETTEGRRLVFRVSVTRGDTLVAAGRVTRVKVRREHFMERLHAPSS